MAIQFTEKQTRVLEARDHNILVSAAAGSGKTAVLVERIVRMISEGERPLDIDRLLVVTFTRAAAAQMRERIARAVSDRLRADPSNAHLRRQETLIHNAQITTIDSFCSYLLRNNFSEIDLDPDFRVMDQTESELMSADVLDSFLEECYQQADPAFLECAAYFCPGSDDRGLQKMIADLYTMSSSRPQPEFWLKQRREDYHVESKEEIFTSLWLQTGILQTLEQLEDMDRQYSDMLEICGEPDGPEGYAALLTLEQDSLFGKLRREPVLSIRQGHRGSLLQLAGSLDAEQAKAVWDLISGLRGASFGRLPALGKKRYPNVSESKKNRVKDRRAAIKTKIASICGKYSESSADLVFHTMRAADGPLRELVDLTLAYAERYRQAKREKNLLDFPDLEHYALQVLLEFHEDGTCTPRPAAMEYRRHFAEILIDEYQDSNDVQELLLRTISTEDEGRNNRFMVGDVKQSIYKFRLARPEIFMEKFDTYRPFDPATERIDLDQNFRSRRQVLDSVNDVFERIMRREIGGVQYDDTVSLKLGASYPEAEAADGEDPYRTELLLVDGAAANAAAGAGGQTDVGPSDSGQTDDGPADSEIPSAAELSSRRREALAVAYRIRQIVGHLPVKDDRTGETRPASYGDIVILLRSSLGWNEEFRDIFEKEGIPAYVESRTGYFSAFEVRTIMQMLRIIDNPRQDIPFYGAMRSWFGRFSDDEIVSFRAGRGNMTLYEAAIQQAEEEPDSPAGRKCRDFLEFLDTWRDRSQWMSIHELLDSLIRDTGYADFVAALPGGEQRSANLQMFSRQALSFEKTAYTGLFQFIRYIDQMHSREVDYGEANILDEHADVVRIMTIHKSKGLEFPVCFVCGLHKKYSFNSNDASGDLICDTDWGIGVNYMDPSARLKATTFRREMIADKIRRDSLGEELRVLYVAMTRAKEKLILTAYHKDVEDLLDKAAEKAAGTGQEETHLPFRILMESGSYLDLLLAALYARSGGAADLLADDPAASVAVSRVPVDEMTLHALEEQAGMEERLARLSGLWQADRGSLPDRKLAEWLDLRLSWQYAHGNLRDLYTKTSVSELKMAAMQEHESGQAAAGEGARPLFHEEEENVLPRFIRRRQAEEQAAAAEEAGPEAAPEAAESGSRDGGKKSLLSGAAYGTAVHRIMELMDYDRFGDPDSVTPGKIMQWIEELEEGGRIPPEYRQALRPRPFLRFLQGDLGRRMGRAARAGRLYREQPFVLGLPASRLREDFPSEETIMIQGIIDAFFEEEGGLVLVDYKTDHVENGRQLADRYRTQMVYYAKTLASVYHKPVREIILYAFGLGGEEVRLDPPEPEAGSGS